MKKGLLCWICLAGWMYLAIDAGAQEKLPKNKTLNQLITREVVDHITITPQNDSVPAVRSEDAFMPYSGKIIRYICIDQVGFERSIYDTTRTIRNRVTRIANALHTDTRERTIRENLFIREGKPLNPYRVADNERYLRDLDFILDSKIIVLPIEGTSDSVDLQILTRDVFSLGIDASSDDIDEYTVGLYDANLFGRGQRIQADIGFDPDRNPITDYDLYYRKASLGGSLVNTALGYTRLNNARSVGEEFEHAYFLRLDRPLVSPYSRLAGGLEISNNWSRNVYTKVDTAFRNYRYNIEDIWIGYNLGINNNFKNRNRHFAALRYYRQHYSRQPVQQAERSRSLYNDQQFLLGEITFYNKNYYKTRYVYGFGRTEDIPYGHTMNITSGWVKELGQKRMYLGASATKSVVHRDGNFYEIAGGVGSFFDARKTEDGFVFVNAQFYSKLFVYNHAKVRHQVNVGYARAFNNQLRELISINNDLFGFSADSLFGTRRYFARGESTIFTNWELAGFRFAPFLSLESGYLVNSRNTELNNESLFIWGSTGGIRIRNENLIFGTVELRMFYFPVDIAGIDRVSFKISTNLRLKYSGTFVRPPSLVQYN